MYVFMNQQVCREAFISLHGITENRAKTVRSKATHVDMQGWHHNHPHKIMEDLQNHVTVHNSTPRVPSIYRFYLVKNDKLITKEKRGIQSLLIQSH